MMRIRSPGSPSVCGSPTQNFNRQVTSGQKTKVALFFILQCSSKVLEQIIDATQLIGIDRMLDYFTHLQR